jgi:hypothetical protein
VSLFADVKQSLLQCEDRRWRKQRRYVGQTIVTTDGHQVREEGRHGSMIIQPGGHSAYKQSGMDIYYSSRGFEIYYIYVDASLVASAIW